MELITYDNESDALKVIDSMDERDDLDRRQFQHKVIYEGDGRLSVLHVDITDADDLYKVMSKYPQHVTWRNYDNIDTDKPYIMDMGVAPGKKEMVSFLPPGMLRTAYQVLVDSGEDHLRVVANLFADRNRIKFKAAREEQENGQ